MAQQITGGRTNMGRSMNKGLTKTDSVVADRKGVVYGELVEVVNNEYRFKIQLYDRDGNLTKVITRGIRLEGDIGELAQIAQPKEMLGEFLVRVDFSGPSANRGTATIVRQLKGSHKDTAEQAIELPVTGVAYAQA